MGEPSNEVSAVPQESPFVTGKLNDTGSVQISTWANALAHAEASTFASYTDWRLPNVKELSSLVEDCRAWPAINTNRFPNTPSEYSPTRQGARFWSGSPYARISDGAWVADFNRGSVNYVFRDNDHFVRLVRGGQ